MCPGIGLLRESWCCEIPRNSGGAHETRGVRYLGQPHGGRRRSLSSSSHQFSTFMGRSIDREMTHLSERYARKVTLSGRNVPFASGEEWFRACHGIRNTHAGGAGCILVLQHKPQVLCVRGRSSAALIMISKAVCSMLLSSLRHAITKSLN